MSVRPTTPAPSPFGLETHRPAYADRSANDNQKAVSGLQVTKASRDVVFDIEDLRGKLRLRRSLPPKF